MIDRVMRAVYRSPLTFFVVSVGCGVAFLRHQVGWQRWLFFVAWMFFAVCFSTLAVQRWRPTETSFTVKGKTAAAAPDGPMFDASVATHEWFKTLCAAGFTSDEALSFIAKVSTETNRQS